MYKFVKDNVNIWDASFMQKEGVRCYTRLLYMYFLTCPLSNILGIYEISERRIKSDLRLDNDEFITAMQELKTLKKVRKLGKFIIIKDAIHYLKKDAKTFKEIDKIIAFLPQKIKEKIPKKALETIEAYKRKQEKKRILRIQKKLLDQKSRAENLIDVPNKNITGKHPQLALPNGNLLDQKSRAENALEADAKNVSMNGLQDALPIGNLLDQKSVDVNANEVPNKSVKCEGLQHAFLDQKSKADSGIKEDYARDLFNCPLQNEDKDCICDENTSNIDALPYLPTHQDFDSFMAEPSEISLNARVCDDDCIEKNTNKQHPDDDFFKYDVSPSKISMEKMQDAQKRKRKVEMSDEVMFSLLKKRLEPIYARMNDSDFLPSKEIAGLARKELLNFMKEYDIKAEPLDTSFLNMREFMKQAISFPNDKDVKNEREAFIAKTNDFPNDKEIRKERDEFIAKTKEFPNDKEIKKERDEFIAKTNDFYNDPESYRIRTGKDFLDVRKNYDEDDLQNFGFFDSKDNKVDNADKKNIVLCNEGIVGEEAIVLTKAEFDDYILKLNNELEIEEDKNVKKDIPYIKRTWEFYKKFEQFKNLSFDDFCEQFELAKRHFVKWNVDITDEKQLNSLLERLERYVRKYNSSQCSIIPFSVLSRDYNFYEPRLKKC